MTTNATQLPDFPATTSQLYKVSEIREHFDDLTKFMPTPVEAEIRLAGTRRTYKVRIGLYAIPRRTVGLDIWAPSDEA